MDTPSATARRAASVVLIGAFILAGIGALQAHVTVYPREVRAGGYEKFMVRVPSERPEPTVRVRLEFPEGITPRFQPKAGWTYEVESDASGRVVAVTWSGGQIGPNEFEEFAFTARAPEQPGRLTFRAHQTYQSGTVVSWINGPDAPEPAAVVEVRDSTMPSAALPAAPSGFGWVSGLALALAAIALALSAVRPRQRA